MYAPFSRVTVTLPTFVIVALRDMVEGTEYSVSDLLTGRLLRSFSKEDLLNVADKHPEFKPIVEAWLMFRQELLQRPRSN